MLIAHLAPGFVAAIASQKHWDSEWGPRKRTGLWMAALGSTFVPDLDVVYNVLTTGIVNHRTLYTHSIFVHGIIALVWIGLVLAGRWRYGTLLAGLAAAGGFSHLILDMIAHNTPLFYPVSMRMVGIAPERVVEGGIGAYLTHPVVLLEPLLIGCVWFYACSVRQNA